MILGLAQPVGLAAAFGRVLDPGPATFEAIGTIAGLGMAAGAAAVGLERPPASGGWLPRLERAAIIAGLVSAGTWLSLFGDNFLTYDTVRIGALVLADVVFAAWLLAISRAFGERGPLEVWPVAVLMTLRAVTEALLFVPVTMPTPTQPGAQAAPVPLFLGITVLLLGYLVLAWWEAAVGIRLCWSAWRRSSPGI